MRAIALFAAALAVSGCESMDRDLVTHVLVTGPGQMSVHVKGVALYGNDAADRWVNDIVSESGYCPHGFDVTGKETFNRKTALGTTLPEFTYQVRCRQKPSSSSP